MSTDLERAGLGGRRLEPDGREWLLTIDFEAFRADRLRPWLHAMRAWAREARRHRMAFSTFIAVEDVDVLRLADPGAHASFMEGIAGLIEAGMEFHPHNHWVYDRDSGARRTPKPDRPVVPGYRKRMSFFHDAVHVNGVDLSDWMGTVLAAYREFMAEAGAAPPPRPAFRAGGWDSGSSDDDLRTFVRALADNGFAYDSSAARADGAGNRTPYGRNAFELAPGLAEVAPVSHMNARAPALSRRTVRIAAELLANPRLWAPPSRPGALVTVIHIDNVLHTGRGSRVRKWTVEDPETIERRVASHFRQLAAIRRLLRLRCATFEDLRLRPAGG